MDAKISIEQTTQSNFIQIYIKSLEHLAKVTWLKIMFYSNKKEDTFACRFLIVLLFWCTCDEHVKNYHSHTYKNTNYSAIKRKFKCNLKANNRIVNLFINDCYFPLKLIINNFLWNYFQLTFIFFFESLEIFSLE